MTDGQTVMPGRPLDDRVVHSFRSRLSGQLILPDDPGYSDARTIYNAMIDRYPALIARCADTNDVVSAVNIAREHDLRLSVRGGGHSVAGKSLVDDGVVVDLSRMNDVRVDPDNRKAFVQGGATWRDVDHATHEHGLATPGGLVSSTGVGGLTLGGGLAWLMRKHGMACDNLSRAEVVTADGSIVYASEAENPDLYWGLRGGGGNFGVVTGFEFRLHPVHTVLGGMILHPFERSREALEFLREFNLTAPEELTVIAALMTTPDGDKVAAFVLCYAGDPEQGEQVIKPLLEWGPPLSVEVGPIPYPQMQQLLDEAWPHGLQNYWRSSLLPNLSDEVIDAMIDHFERVPSPLTVLLLERFGGAVGRVPTNATSFPHRDAQYNLAITARWTDPAEAQTHIDWARGLDRAVAPYATGGSYVNYLTDEGRDPVQAAYGDDTYARLAELKARWDPENLFEGNQNVQPAR